MKIEVLKLNNKTSFFNKLKRYKKQILISVLLLFFSICFVLNSSKYINVVLEGILLYGTKVLPSLFPFFFITKILGSFDVLLAFCNRFKKITKILFNTPAISCYIYFMSIISGYPMGAKLTSDFYEAKLINKNQAQRIMSFCSTSGPLFVIGSVGVGFFANTQIGVMLFISHILASFINGLIFRNYSKKNELKLKNSLDENSNIKNNSNKFSLEDTMYSTIKSVLIVGGYIVIFYTLIEVLLDLNIFYPFIKLLNLIGLNKIEATGLLSGIIEVTKGASILCKTTNLKIGFILTSGIISFSGFSIFVQSLTFLNKIKLNKKLFILQKITHSFITLAISYLISLFLF